LYLVLVSCLLMLTLILLRHVETSRRSLRNGEIGNEEGIPKLIDKVNHVHHVHEDTEIIEKGETEKI
jgi:hypothetical protein